MYVYIYIYIYAYIQYTFDILSTTFSSLDWLKEHYLLGWIMSARGQPGRTDVAGDPPGI